MTDPSRPVTSLYRAAARQILAVLADRVRATVTTAGPRVVLFGDELGINRRVAPIVARLAAQGEAAARKAVADAAAAGDRMAARQARLPDPPPLGQGERDRIADDLAGRLRPVHAAILRRTPDVYRQVIAEAMLTPSATGNPEVDRLVRAQRALNRFADLGVVDFTDQAGRHWNIVSYVEQATRAATTRAHIAAYTQRLVDAGHNLVVVSDHLGACKLCEPWEGRVLRLRPSPAAQAITLLDEDGARRRSQVAGTLAEALAAGLFHPNCSHTVNAFTDGVTVVPRVHPDPQLYADRQRLRAMERHVRMWRQREVAALTPAARRDARARRRAWQHAITVHVARTGVDRRRQREHITAAR